MIVLIIVAGAIAIIGSVAIWFFASRSADAAGMRGRITYADEPDDELFISARFGLIGRPDFILKERGEYVPVERKSRRVSRKGPYEGEILQLAACCLLVEEHHKVTVRRGQLQYLNRSIDIPFDDAVRGRLLRKLEAVDQASLLREVPRSHASPARCRNCEFRNDCGQALK